MKKILLILIVLIVAGVAGMPYVNGMITQKVVTAAFEDINQMYTDSGYDIKMEILEYDRGFSSSRIEWQMTFGSLSAVYGLENITFVDDATHGLLSVVSETSLEKNQWFTDWVAARQDGKNPLKIHTRYPAFGPIVSDITLDPFSIDADGETLDIGSLELAMTVDRALTTFSSKGKWEGITGVDGNIGPVTLDAESSRVTSMIWEGKGNIGLEKFHVVDSDTAESVDFSGLDVDFDISAGADKKRMNVDMGVALDTIMIDGQTLSDWSFRWGIGHIDIQAYESLIVLYSEMMNEMLAQVENPGADPGVVNDMMMDAMARNSSQLMAEAEKLLKKDFQIRVSDLDIGLPQGRVKGSLSLGLKKDMTMAQFFPLMSQPSLALDIFSLKSDVRFPENMAAGNPNLTMPVFPGMKTGLFVQEGTDLHHWAETRDNRLYLNGEEVVLN
ncbi:MAG: DUF945 family protein [Desulfobacter sp.]